MANTTLTIPAPGILANDSDADGDSLTAILAAGPTKGTLSLSPNGSFTYIPAGELCRHRQLHLPRLGRTDQLQPGDGEHFGNHVHPIVHRYFHPHQPVALGGAGGNWAPRRGAKGGTNAPASYGNTYLTNLWGDYSVQARVQLPAGGFGGGVAGRLNPATGARYAAWIYPEGSPGGSSVLKLLKFQTWGQFTMLQQTSLPSVGTNWHTLKLVMQGNRIAVHYDGTLMLSVTDTALPHWSAEASASTFRPMPTLDADRRRCEGKRDTQGFGHERQLHGPHGRHLTVQPRVCSPTTLARSVVCWRS